MTQIWKNTVLAVQVQELGEKIRAAVFDLSKDSVSFKEELFFDQKDQAISFLKKRKCIPTDLKLVTK